MRPPTEWKCYNKKPVLVLLGILWVMQPNKIIHINNNNTTTNSSSSDVELQWMGMGNEQATTPHCTAKWQLKQNKTQPRTTAVLCVLQYFHFRFLLSLFFFLMLLLCLCRSFAEPPPANALFSGVCGVVNGRMDDRMDGYTNWCDVWSAHTKLLKLLLLLLLVLSIAMTLKMPLVIISPGERC